ncbi:MAG: hypothetical protein ACFFCQ_12910, partial [Promethearchaeota archaeon]
MDGVLSGKLRRNRQPGTRSLILTILCYTFAIHSSIAFNETLCIPNKNLLLTERNNVFIKSILFA